MQQKETFFWNSLAFSMIQQMLAIWSLAPLPFLNIACTSGSSWLRKGRETRDQIANICWIMERAKKFQRNIYFFIIDYAKAFDCVHHNKLWKIFEETGIPDHLTCLLRNLYTDQDATVRTGHETTDWFQIGKGVRQGCILSPCFLTYMQSTSWEMPGWMKLKLEWRLLGEISITSHMQMTPPLLKKAKN